MVVSTCISIWLYHSGSILLYHHENTWTSGCIIVYGSICLYHHESTWAFGCIIVYGKHVCIIMRTHGHLVVS